MATIILVNFFAFLIVSSIGILKGLDLKKRSSWLYGLYGFVTGFLIGFLESDGAGNLRLATNWVLSLQGGALLAFIPMYGGAMTRWHRQRFSGQ
jgi:hypothetical protein